MSGDHRDDRGRPELDRDGVPLPTEPPGELAEVFPRHPPTAAFGLAAQPGRGLLVEDLGAVLDRVDHAGPPGWLVQGLWPADAYGVLAAEDKAGKTWAILDLACSVAAGRPWLSAFPCPQAGRVLVFLGEGDQRAMVRRLRAICAHKDLQAEELAARIRLCFRVPRLTSGADLAAVGRGAKRISGVGPGAWGRVLCSAAVAHRTTSPDGASTVVLGFEVIGGELADTAFRVRRL